ncbi:uncharacterized protein [Bemisia tabaci]|uniref:uncharacterized protein n=1 Tax=Bemisia tabaci TaxID=7038 RepID=UPI003B28462D
MEKSRLRLWNEIINEIQSKNPFQSWSKQKKSGLKIGVALIFSFLAIGPISVLSELIEKYLMREYESMFRLLAQLPVATITPIFAVVFVKTFREFCHFELALKGKSTKSITSTPQT